MTIVPGPASSTASHLPPTALRARTSVRRLLYSRWQLGTERFKQFFMLPDCYRKIRAILVNRHQRECFAALPPNDRIEAPLHATPDRS